MTRTDSHPFPVPGMRPTGHGAFAECPDHGHRLAHRVDDAGATVFACPACDPADGALAARDVYLEWCESWRVVDGCLYVDEHEEEDDDDA